MTPAQLARVTAYRRAPHNLPKQEAIVRVEAEVAEEEGLRPPSVPFTDSDLAICYLCPDYERFDIQERCWLGLTRGGCSRDAVSQWYDRALGRQPRCAKQVAARRPVTLP